MSRSMNKIIDTLLELEDGAAAIVAAGAGSDILDVGSNYVMGKVIFDVSAIVVTTDETYLILVQGSNSATFASGIENLAQLELAKAANKLGGADVVGATGRKIIPVENSLDNGNTTYRYLRLWVIPAGTAESITFKSWFTKAA